MIDQTRDTTKPAGRTKSALVMTIKKTLIASVFAVACSLVFSSSVMAKDLSKGDSWKSSKMECDDMETSMKNYFKDDGYKSEKVAVSYCNAGMYAVKSVRLKIWGESGLIYNRKIEQNLTASWGHDFLVNIGQINKGDELKMEVTYNILSGDKKHCVKEFTYEHTDVMWMVLSSGTETAANKCRKITFKQKDS